VEFVSGVSGGRTIAGEDLVVRMRIDENLFDHRIYFFWYFAIGSVNIFDFGNPLWETIIIDQSIELELLVTFPSAIINDDVVVAFTRVFYIDFFTNGGYMASWDDYSIIYTPLNAVVFPEPRRTGFTFDGWFDNPSFTGTAVTEIPLGSVGHREYWAKWVTTGSTTFTVSFNTHGGSTIASRQISSGSLITNLTNPTRSGFIFDGWFLNATYTQPFNILTTPVTSNITLHARWTAESVETPEIITFFTVGTVIPMGSSLVGVAMNLQSNAPSNRVSFRLNFESGSSLLFEPEPSKNNMWRLIYLPSMTTFYFENARHNPFSATVNTWAFPRAETVSSILVSGFTATSIDISREFLNFYIQGPAAPSNNFQIIYHLNGGQNPADAPLTYTSGTALTLPVPTQSGFVFLGWFTHEFERVTEIPATATGNFTIWADWTGDFHTVVFDGNGATGGTMSEQVFVWNVFQNLNLNTFTRAGFWFAGWSRFNDATEPEFTDGQNVRNLTYTVQGTAILFAVWTPTGSGNPVLTGTAVISIGSTAIGAVPPRIGDVLSASYVGGNGVGTASFEWSSGGVVVSTGPTFTVIAEDLGQTLRLSVSFPGNSGTVLSANTAPVLKMAGPVAPPLPTLSSRTTNSITLALISDVNVEFSRNGGVSWQTNVFAGLSPDTEYTFIQRIRETATVEASPASAGLTVRTLPLESDLSEAEIFLQTASVIAVLAMNPALITLANETAINTVLGLFNSLAPATQTELSEQKAHIDVLINAIEAIKALDAHNALVQSITIQSAPAKLIYQLGEDLVLEGLVVRATRNDQTTFILTVTADMVTGFDKNTVGLQIVTVRYSASISTTFGVTVQSGGVVLPPGMYTITYHLDGGQNPFGATISYIHGVGTPLPAPTRNGFLFAGWYECPDFEDEPMLLISAEASGNIELYARWEQAPSVRERDLMSCGSFMSGSGTGGVLILAVLFAVAAGVYVAGKRKVNDN
jgi:uncharacterized repeat protein (TIGR02543 family)